ncbi:MAG: ribonuclease H-like domain-containing protein [Desulfobacterales bacterium]
MKIAAFDLEIAKEIPNDVLDWQTISPLGITCASVAHSDSETPSVWQGVPQMTREECRELVGGLQDLVSRGYVLVTWNGCSFDFAVLAEESGMVSECAELAMNHVDLMLIVTFTKGWFLGLQKALEGAKVEGKVKSVQLSDGSTLKGMHGSKAPALWERGEYEAVLTYLNGDVVQLLRLVEIIQRDAAISWISGTGNRQRVAVKKLLTVRECFDIPEPDVSWMDDPPTRQQFIRWMEP